MTSAKKTDPDLWKRVKDEYLKSDRGGEPGQWSARKAQLAVQEYQRRGGGYASDGPDRSETGLHAWTEEDWGTRSGRDSAASGERYLPKKVRMLLTEDEYRRSTEKKKSDRRGGEQFSDQPEDVRRKVARIRKHGPSKNVLCARARDLDIDGRSKMSERELLRAIERATDENGRDRRPRPALRKLSKAQLYAKAKRAGVEGRSSMSKTELAEALAGRD